MSDRSERREVVGEDRDDVERAVRRRHGRRGRAARAAGRRRPGRPRRRPRARSRRRTAPAPRGRRPGRTTSRSWAGRCSRPLTSPSRLAGEVSTTRSPTSSSSYQRVLVGVVDDVLGVDEQPGAAQPLGAGAVGDPLERRAARCRCGRRALAQRQHARHPGAGAGLGREPGARTNRASGSSVCACDGHLAAQPVRLADPGDDDAPWLGCLLREKVGNSRKGYAGTCDSRHTPRLVCVVTDARLSGPGRCRRCRSGPAGRPRGHPSRCAARWRCGRTGR